MSPWYPQQLLRYLFNLSISHDSIFFSLRYIIAFKLQHPHAQSVFMAQLRPITSLKDPLTNFIISSARQAKLQAKKREAGKRDFYKQPDSHKVEYGPGKYMSLGKVHVSLKPYNIPPAKYAKDQGNAKRVLIQALIVFKCRYGGSFRALEICIGKSPVICEWMPLRRMQHLTISETTDPVDHQTLIDHLTMLLGKRTGLRVDNIC